MSTSDRDVPPLFFLSNLLKRLHIPIDPDHLDLTALSRDRVDAANRIQDLETALRRIRSLAEKNVPKYAQEIAREALDKGVGK